MSRTLGKITNENTARKISKVNLGLLGKVLFLVGNPILRLFTFPLSIIRLLSKGKKVAKFIGVGYPSIGPKEKEYVLDTLNKNRLSYGAYTAEFEKKFAHHHQRKFAIFCNSGTSALQAGLHALKIKHNWKDNDEIIVPALTFVASVNVVLQNQLKPAFVDVEPDYYGIDPEKIEEKISKRTKAIMPVHLFGLPCDMNPIIKIAKKYNLSVIEDSCETMFARYRGNSVGSWGEISCFSTYAAHLLVTGVGGFATTNDPDLAVIIKSLFNHGRDGSYTTLEDTLEAQRKPRQLRAVVSRRFNFIYQGYSSRATELEGAIGLAQIERWKEIIGGHQKNAAYLTNKLKAFSEYFQLPTVRPWTTHAFMMYPLVIKTPKKVNREGLIIFLEKNMIETRYLLPLLNQPVYTRLWGNLEKQYPVAKNINNNGFYIGCHQDLTRSDLDYVVKKFEEYLKIHNLI